jgi:hypothetical protein
LEGVLLSNQDISTIEHHFSTCKTRYISLKNIKMSKLALANGLWIGITPKNITQIDKGRKNLDNMLLLLYHIGQIEVYQ